MTSQENPPSNSLDDKAVPDYFFTQGRKRWREDDFKAQHPQYDFLSEVHKLSQRKHDGDKRLKRLIAHAKHITKTRANNITNLIYHPNSVKIHNDIVSKKRRLSDESSSSEEEDEDEDYSASDTDPAGPGTPPAADNSNVQNTETSVPTPSDTLSPGLQGPRPSLSGCVFLEGPGAPGALSASTIKALNDRFPKLPPASPYFHAALEACKPMIDDPSYWPSPPHLTTTSSSSSSKDGPVKSPDWADEDEVEQRKIWSYVFTAVSYFANNYATLRLRAPSHGEGWADANIWPPLWDHAFMKSSTLTIDRKELSPKFTIAIKHDGILRSAKTSCSRNLGFMEVKPDRNTNSKGTVADRLKVIESIVATLKAHNTPGIVIGGIICHGMTFNIIRGADMGGGTYAFKESEMEVEMETLAYVVVSCWRMKLALEKSYEAIVGTMPRNVFE